MYAIATNDLLPKLAVDTTFGPKYLCFSIIVLLALPVNILSLNIFLFLHTDPQCFRSDPSGEKCTIGGQIYFCFAYCDSMPGGVNIPCPLHTQMNHLKFV